MVACFALLNIGASYVLEDHINTIKEKEEIIQELMKEYTEDNRCKK